MYDDFYTTLAQVLPVLLLALIWDSQYLDQLRRQPRPSRRTDPANGYFWTKPRVRAYSLTVASVIVVELAVVVLVLSGALTDSTVLRTILVAGLLLALSTLLTRVAVDVVDATRSEPPTPAARPAGGSGAGGSGAGGSGAGGHAGGVDPRTAPDEVPGTSGVTDDTVGGRSG